ncbi:hypothetical protein ACLIIZ_11740 [Azonexus caeni]|uniref:hypothetical protein n=1 Tax=Azonexus caeni TaxID=266126 RepID=UPI003A8BC1E8
MLREPRLCLLLSLLLVSPLAVAQAYKCRTPDGRTVFYERPCEGAERTLKAVPGEAISEERQAEARAAHQRRQLELQRLEEEAAATKPPAAANALPSATADGASPEQRKECGDLARNARLTAAQQAALGEICARPPRDAGGFASCRKQILDTIDADRNALIASTCTGDPEAGQRVLAAARPAVRHSPRPLIVSPPPHRPSPNPQNPRDCSKGGCAEAPVKPAAAPAINLGAGGGKNCRMQGNQILCN